MLLLLAGVLTTSHILYYLGSLEQGICPPGPSSVQKDVNKCEAERCKAGVKSENRAGLQKNEPSNAS